MFPFFKSVLWYLLSPEYSLYSKHFVNTNTLTKIWKTLEFCLLETYNTSLPVIISIDYNDVTNVTEELMFTRGVLTGFYLFSFSRRLDDELSCKTFL